MRRKARVFPCFGRRNETDYEGRVNTMYRLLGQCDHDPEAYLKSLAFGERHTQKWGDPEIETPLSFLANE